MNIEIESKCVICQDVIKLTVKAKDYSDWQGGKHIQHAFPYINAGERELLISGICGPCFDKIM